MEPTKEQREANVIYEKLSKAKLLHTIDPAIKVLALQFRQMRRDNRTPEQRAAKIKADNDRYYEQHDHHLAYQEARRQTEEHKQYLKEYRASETGLKSTKITRFKQAGILCDDYDAMYERWKNTTHCDKCNIELVNAMKGKNRKVTDYDPKTKVFRNILCYGCDFETMRKEKNEEKLPLEKVEPK
jgi:hypothetical protein